MINNKTCEISFDLDFPIEIASGSGDEESVSQILFRKPNRQSGPLFQNLVSSFNRAINKSMMEMKALASVEEIEDAQQKALAKQEKIDDVPILKSILDVTLEEILKEAVELTALVTGSDFNFEKGYKLFFKMLLSVDKRYTMCELGGKKLTDAMLDRIDYQDHLKMMVVYISFFGKPAKSGTTTDSDKQLESPMPAREV